MADDPSLASVVMADDVFDFVLEATPDDIPASALKTARLLLLDTLGVAAAASPTGAGRLARETAIELFGAGPGSAAAAMLFDGRFASPAGAAYAAATQIDNLDAHDGYNPTKGHIGVAAVPALLVFAQTSEDMFGREALADLVIGYEVAARAGISLHASVSDYHTSGAWNALGVAAIGTRRWRLDRERLRHALGIAEYHGPRSQMMREIANPTMLHDGSGWGALAGVSAVSLAKKGFTGAPAITLEAEKTLPHWADLGRLWTIERQYIKPYPICRWAHAALDAARELRLRHGIGHEQIARIHVNTFREASRLFRGMPDTTSKAQYSLAFAVATLMVRGHLGPTAIEGAALSDPDVARLVDRIFIEETETHSRRFPAGRWSDLTVELVTGEVLSSGDTQARGGPERPLSEQEILDKYFEFAEPVLGRSRAAAVKDTVLSLGEPKVRFSSLLSLLADPPGGRAR